MVRIIASTLPLYYANGNECDNLWSGMIVANGKLSSKRAMVAGTIVVVAILAGLLLIAKPSLFDSTTQDGTAVAVEDIQSHIARFAAEGDNNGALGFYDEQVKLRSDKKEKQLILMMKSRFALGEELMDEAIDAAKKANDIGQNNSTLSTLAEAYLANGQKEQALVYYKKIRDLNIVSNNKAPSRGSTLEEKIRELEQ